MLAVVERLVAPHVEQLAGLFPTANPEGSHSGPFIRPLLVGKHTSLILVK